MEERPKVFLRARLDPLNEDSHENRVSPWVWPYKERADEDPWAWTPAHLRSFRIASPLEL
jgi:hypothetical protein